MSSAILGLRFAHNIYISEISCARSTKGLGIGNASRERIVTELNLTMLVTGLLIISSLPEGKKVLRPNNNPADFERSELVGMIAKLIQQSIAVAVGQKIAQYAPSAVHG